MRRITRKVLTATGLAATTVALVAVPASAGPVTYAVQNGGDVAGSNVGDIVGFGSINGAVLKCTSSTAHGSMPNGTGLSGTGIATLDGVSFSSPGANPEDWCVTNNSIPTEVTAVGLPWSFDATGPNGANPMDGRLNNVLLRLHTPSVPCDVTLGGPGPNGSGGFIEGAYTNPSTLAGNSGTMSVPFMGVNNLRVLSASRGCSAGFASLTLGETVSLAGTYNMINTNGISPAID